MRNVFAEQLALTTAVARLQRGSVYLQWDRDPQVVVNSFGIEISPHLILIN